MSLVFKAMNFARRVHAGQVRKYTGEPYFSHLAEVAGIVASVGLSENCVAVAWLHDCIEDQEIQASELWCEFSWSISQDVLILSDLEKGNRAERKAAGRARLAAAPSWVQTIKCADLISNTSSIVKHDPKFAAIYLEEKRLLLDVMKHADARLLAMAYEQVVR